MGPDWGGKTLNEYDAVPPGETVTEDACPLAGAIEKLSTLCERTALVTVEKVESPE